MVITMAKLHMAHASTNGARKHAWRTQAAWAKIDPYRLNVFIQKKTSTSSILFKYIQIILKSLGKQQALKNIFLENSMETEKAEDQNPEEDKVSFTI